MFVPPKPDVTSDQSPIIDSRLEGKCTVQPDTPCSILLNWFVKLPNELLLSAGNEIEVKLVQLRNALAKPLASILVTLSNPVDVKLAQPWNALAKPLAPILVTLSNPVDVKLVQP